LKETDAKFFLNSALISVSQGSTLNLKSSQYFCLTCYATRC